jgi:hypothetical protein
LTGHTIIIGKSRSGKSTITKLIAAASIKRGVRVAVSDPRRDREWVEMGAYLARDTDDLIAWAKANKGKGMLIADEGGESVGREKRYAYLTTAARHDGHTSIIIAHYATQVTPVMRENCDRVILFSASAESREILYKKYEDKAILTPLPQYHFMIVEEFKATVRGKVFPDKISFQK